MSVVDYDAWKRGYMPPTEHVLIHELSHEGAKVIAMSSIGKGTWWLVVKGDLDRKLVAAMCKSVVFTLHEMDEMYAEPPSASDLPKSESE